jgi:hypothetical protein
VYRTLQAEDPVLIDAWAGTLDTGFWPSLSYNDDVAAVIGSGGWFVIRAGHGGKGWWHIRELMPIPPPAL